MRHTRCSVHAGHSPRADRICLCVGLLRNGCHPVAPQYRPDRPVLFLAVAASLAAEIPRKHREDALLSWALTLAGALYVGWLMSHFLLLRQIDQPLSPAPLGWLRLDAGAAWIVFAMTITFVSDTSAYVVGRHAGTTPDGTIHQPQEKLGRCRSAA